MPEKSNAAGGRTLVVAAALIVVIAGLRAAADLIVPFLFAVFLAMVSLPLLTFLQRRRIAAGIAVVVTVLVELGLLAGVVTFVGGSIGGFVERAPEYRARLEGLAGGVLDWAHDRGLELDIQRDTLFEAINPGVAFDFLRNTFANVAGVLSQTVIVLLYLVLILLEASGFSEKLAAAFGERAASARYAKIREDVWRYLAIKTLVSLATGTFVGVAMWAIGIDFPLLWGLLAFLLNYIPNLGSILAAIPPVLLALLQFGVTRALVVAAVFVGVNMVLGNLVEPRLMGRRLGLSTLVVFLSLVFWGWVWGPIGMLLSVPLTMIVKIMLENTTDLRWVAVLLGDRPSDAGPAVAGTDRPGSDSTRAAAPRT